MSAGVGRRANAQRSPPPKSAAGRSGSRRRRVRPCRPRSLPRSRASHGHRSSARPRSATPLASSASAAARPDAPPAVRRSWTPPVDRHSVSVPQPKTIRSRQRGRRFPSRPAGPSLFLQGMRFMTSPRLPRQPSAPHVHRDGIQAVGTYSGEADLAARGAAAALSGRLQLTPSRAPAIGKQRCRDSKIRSP